MEENAVKLQKIIAAYTPFNYQDIDLKKTIKDKYVAKEFKDNFSNDICTTWRSLNCTQVHNGMFVELKTGEDILKILKFIEPIV